MLQFTSHDTLAVHVGQFFDFLQVANEKNVPKENKEMSYSQTTATYKSSFHASSKVVSSTHDKQRFVLEQRLGQFLDLIVELQNFADLIVQVLQSLDNLAKTTRRILLSKRTNKKGNESHITQREIEPPVAFVQEKSYPRS